MRSNQWFVRIAIVAVVCLVLGGGIFFVGQAFGGLWQLPNVGFNRINIGPITVGNKRYTGPLDNKVIALESFGTLDIELSLVELVIKEGEEVSLELVNIPANTMKTKQTGNQLRIYNEYERMIDYQFGNIENKAILTIPKELLESVEIELSLGVIRISSMQTKYLDIQSSMTSIDIKNLSSQGLTIDSSMADIGVSGTLEGKTTIQNSMGNVEISIYGNSDDYAYQLSNSMGSLSFDRMSFDGMSSNTKGNPQGIHSIHIDNSMGNVDVKFH